MLTAFDRSGIFVELLLPKVVDLGVTNDGTGQVKVKMYDDLAYLVLSHTAAVSNGNKSQQH